MKVIIVIALLLHLLVFSNQEQPKDEESTFEGSLETISKECMNQFNIKHLPEVLPEENDATNTKDLQCFIKCVYVKTGLMNEAEEINADEMAKHMQPLNQTEASKLVSKCKKQRGVDSCETAYKFSKCTNEAFMELEESEWSAK